MSFARKYASRIFVWMVTATIILAACQSESPTPGVSTIPTPIGYPESAQDVGTLIGKPAPGFTLSDESGQPYTVNPEETVRPVVLIFNMGLG